MNAIEEIKRFQTDRNLHKQDYDALNEHTNIIEELLESIGLDVPKEQRSELQKKIQDCVEETVQQDGIAKIEKPAFCEFVATDAYCDIIVFAIGALMKLGIDPEIALQETAKEINSRKGIMIHGKFEKFVPGDEGYEEPYEADYTKAKMVLS